MLGRIEWAAIGKQVISVHLDRTRDECKNRLDSCTKKHVALADCAETFLTRVFRQAYATIWSVSLALAEISADLPAWQRDGRKYPASELPEELVEPVGRRAQGDARGNGR